MVGELLLGDRILQVNRINVNGATTDEVARMFKTAPQNSEIELVVTQRGTTSAACALASEQQHPGASGGGPFALRPNLPSAVLAPAAPAPRAANVPSPSDGVVSDNGLQPRDTCDPVPVLPTAPLEAVSIADPVPLLPVGRRRVTLTRENGRYGISVIHRPVVQGVYVGTALPHARACGVRTGDAIHSVDGRDLSVLGNDTAASVVIAACKDTTRDDLVLVVGKDAAAWKLVKSAAMKATAPSTPGCRTVSWRGNIDFELAASESESDDNVPFSSC